MDIVSVFSPPIILGFVYSWPEELRASLLFDYTAPTVLTAFASTFVHLDGGHLLVNIGMYLLVVPLLFALCVVNQNRRQFYVVFLTVLFAFPFVLSYLNLAIFRPSAGFGFSGVLMAFVGYLPVALAEYLDGLFDIGPANQTGPLLFLLSLGCISILSLQSVSMASPVLKLGLITSVGIVMAAVLLYTLELYNQRGPSRSQLRAAFQTPGYFELALGTVVVLFAAQFVAFPPSPSSESGVLNLYVHFVGYALGFLVSFTTIELAERFGWKRTAL